MKGPGDTLKTINSKNNCQSSLDIGEVETDLSIFYHFII